MADVPIVCPSKIKDFFVVVITLRVMFLQAAGDVMPGMGLRQNHHAERDDHYGGTWPDRN
jgi:hypothetical protein